MYHVYTCIHVYKINYMLTKSKSNWAYKVLNVQIVISRIVENYSLKLSFYIIIKLNIFQKRFIYKSINLSSPTRYFDCKPKMIFFGYLKRFSLESSCFFFVEPLCMFCYIYWVQKVCNRICIYMISSYA